MKICKKCLQPDTRPKIYFDKEGVCGACLWEDEKKTINWEKRERELKDIAEESKKIAKKRGCFDCAIGVSGGKDSTFQALYARDKLGLNCLLVNAAPAQITEIGKHNIDNLLNLGFDMFTIKVNPKILKKLIRRDFYKYLNSSKATEYPLWASVHHVALAYKIPLIIQGENPALTLGARDGLDLNGNALKIRNTNTISDGGAFEIYSGIENVHEKDLLLYKFPDKKSLEESKIKAIFLQYYTKEWSQYNNAQFAIKNGLRIREDDLNEIGRIHKHTCLDNDFHIVNQLFKYVKFGFGFATDEVCYDIRGCRLTREEGIELIEKYDGKAGQKYIKKFCDFISIDEKEFWMVVNRFRNKELFEETNGEWNLKEEYQIRNLTNT